MSPSVTVSVMSDGVVVLSVRGEIDHGNADALTESIQSVVADRRPRTVRLDLGLVTFIDSGTVGALVRSQRLAGAEGARLVISSASPFVYRQLEVAGVSHLLENTR
jgi:anti-sigma B factor antagonist